MGSEVIFQISQPWGKIIWGARSGIQLSAVGFSVMHRRPVVMEKMMMCCCYCIYLLMRVV